MPGGDQHIAVLGLVSPGVAQAADPKARKRRGQPAIPLLHQYPRGHQDQDEMAPPKGVGCGGDGHVGLARTGDSLDHAAATAT